MPDDADAVIAVVAHGLLNSVSVVQGVLVTLRENWERLPAPVRHDLMAQALAQTDHVGEVLKDLVRGGGTELAALLDELNLPHAQ